MTAHAAHPLSLTRALPPPSAHAGPTASPGTSRTASAAAPLLARPVTITWRALLDPAKPPSAPPAPGAPHSLQIEITLSPDSRATIHLTILDCDSRSLPHAGTSLPAHLHALIAAHPQPAALTLDPTLDLLHAQAPGAIAATFRIQHAPATSTAPALDLLFARTPLLRATNIPAPAFDGPILHH